MGTTINVWVLVVYMVVLIAMWLSTLIKFQKVNFAYQFTITSFLTVIISLCLVIYGMFIYQENNCCPNLQNLSNRELNIRRIQLTNEIQIVDSASLEYLQKVQQYREVNQVIEFRRRQLSLSKYGVRK